MWAFSRENTLFLLLSCARHAYIDGSCNSTYSPLYIIVFMGQKGIMATTAGSRASCCYLQTGPPQPIPRFCMSSFLQCVCMFCILNTGPSEYISRPCKHMFMSIVGGVSTHIAYYIDTLLTLCLICRGCCSFAMLGI